MLKLLTASLLASCCLLSCKKRTETKPDGPLQTDASGIHIKTAAILQAGQSIELSAGMYGGGGICTDAEGKPRSFDPGYSNYVLIRNRGITKETSAGCPPVASRVSKTLTEAALKSFIETLSAVPLAYADDSAPCHTDGFSAGISIGAGADDPARTFLPSAARSKVYCKGEIAVTGSWEALVKIFDDAFDQAQ